MRCMKTGLRFNVPEYNNDTFHADLLYNKSVGCAVIRGLGKAVSDNDPDMRLIPSGDAFGLLSMTDDLYEQLTKYFPDVDLETLKFIIDDTRFF
jgi:hypothetical protein